MLQIIVTVLEQTPAAALDTIRSITQRHDGVELRAEHFPEADLRPFRDVVQGTFIVTWRGEAFERHRVERAIEAGSDLVDVEWRAALTNAALDAFRDRVILSHHDYEGIGEPETLLAELLAFRCNQTKLALTPRNFRENQRLLELMRAHRDDRVTMIGMGGTGLYSRILAPWLGSQFQFVAPGDTRLGAPGQQTLAQANAIYGSTPLQLPPAADLRIFAVCGRPAVHSRSPMIHNERFRAQRLPAAYSIAETESFEDIFWPFAAGAKLAPTGLSVTAPFKEEAYRMAMAAGAQIADHAQLTGVANTLVRYSDRELLADNTDVDGFVTLFATLPHPQRLAILGAGGTARAALAAARKRGIDSITVHARDPHRAATLGEAVRPLEALDANDYDCIVDTLPPAAAVDLRLRAVISLIEAGYPTRYQSLPATVQYRGGLDLLVAQAERQSELFMRCFS